MFSIFARIPPSLPVQVVAQLAMVSLLAVFKDICPGYRIRLPTEKELEVKVSAQTPLLRSFSLVGDCAKRFFCLDQHLSLDATM